MSANSQFLLSNLLENFFKVTLFKSNYLQVYQNSLYAVLGILSLLGVCMLPWTLMYP